MDDPKGRKPQATEWVVAIAVLAAVAWLGWRYTTGMQQLWPW